MDVPHKMADDLFNVTYWRHIYLLLCVCTNIDKYLSDVTSWLWDQSNRRKFSSHRKRKVKKEAILIQECKA